MSASFSHPTALVETEDIGEGTRIWAYAHLLPGVHVGRNCNIGDHCFVETGVFIGDDVTIKNGNMLWKGLTVEDGVFVGPHVFFTNDLYPRSPRLKEASGRYGNEATWLVPTRVAKGATLGAGAIILAGVTIHPFAMVAAGAVVTRDVPAQMLVKGNPARPAGWVCLCGARLRFSGESARCACGLGFRQHSAGVLERMEATP